MFIFNKLFGNLIFSEGMNIFGIPEAIPTPFFGFLVDTEPFGCYNEKERTNTL